MSIEIRIGVVGNVDAGKSTLTSVLVNGKNDDGRGSARESVFNHSHEKKNGRTSSVSHQSLKISNKKSLAFIDLAGHERYLKTTLHGLTGYLIDYVVLIVSANSSVQRMTREHLSIALALKIPFIVVVTKIDLVKDKKNKILLDTLKKIEFTIQKMSSRRNIIKKIKYVNNESEYFEPTDIDVPLFQVSNKTGEGIELLKKFLLNLEENKKIKNGGMYNTLYTVESKYIVPGIGNVVFGKMLKGSVKKNEQLYIGPINGKWAQIVAKSFHDNSRNKIEGLNEGETGTIAFKFEKDKKNVLREMFKRRRNSFKGLIIVGSDKNLDELQHREFEAEIRILGNHSTLIKENYSPIINCRKIVQAATITKIYGKKILMGGDYTKVKFRFNFRPEFIEEGNIFLFREGKTKGIGKITKLY